MGIEKAVNRHSEIFELLLAFQTRRRRLRERYPTGAIEISQAHLLLQLDTEPGSSAQDLAAALQLDKSTISREITRAIERGFLQRQASRSDGRVKTLTITAKGRRVLAGLDDSQAEILRECFADLHGGQEQQLAVCLRMVADGLGAAPLAMRPKDHPVTLENRRFARALGMLGVAMSGSVFSISEVHILLTLSKASAGLAAREILELIPFQPSTLSRKLRRLQQGGWIVQRVNPSDRRSARLSLSAKGETVLKRYLRLISERIEKSLAALNGDKLAEFAAILRAIAGGADRPTIRLRQEVDVRIVSQESERQEIRALLVEQLVRRNAHYAIGPQLLPANNLLAVLYVGKKIRGLCDLSQIGGALCVEQCLVVPEPRKRDGDPSIVEDFVHSVFQHALISTSAGSIKVPPQNDAYRPASRYATVKEIAGVLHIPAASVLTYRS